jgi:hypothetical protein
MAEADNINENFYKIDFKYSEPVDGQVVWSAPSEEEALAGLREAVPPAVTDFVINSIVLVDPESEEYTSFKNALDENRKKLN